jgi:hypothetical protein
MPTAGWPPGRATFPVEPVAVRRISWGAVLAGAAIALVAQLALSLLGLAVGLASFDLTGAVTPERLRGVGADTAVWLVFSSLAALFCGGLVAGRLAGFRRTLDGALHGVVTWALVTLVGAWLVSGAAGGALPTPAVGPAAIGMGEGVSGETALKPADAAKVSTAAAVGFVALALGCLAGASGGALGTPKDQLILTARGEH